LGDRLRVQVAAVNLDERKIDFVLAEPAQQSGKQAGNKPAKKRSRPSRRKRKAAVS
jgi:ribonuclease R